MSAALAQDPRYDVRTLDRAELDRLGPQGPCLAPRHPTARGPRDAAARCNGQSVPAWTREDCAHAVGDLWERCDAPAPPRPPAHRPPKLVAATAQPLPAPPKCPTVQAQNREGASYLGNLLFDIVRYRNLRSHKMDPRGLHADDELLLTQLEGRLRAEADGRTDGRAMRRFVRWEIASIRGVKLADPGHAQADACPSEALPRPLAVETVETVDIGAGGICVVTELTFAAGDEVNILVDCTDDTRARHILMNARVAWSRGRRIGLMFAGGPTWD